MSSSLRLLLACRAASVAAASGLGRGVTAARPAALAMRAISTSRPMRLSSTSGGFPWEGPQEGAGIEDGTEGHTPAGAPWTPTPVAEDYEETIHILLDSNKVEDAIDIFGRMLKRGFRPSSETVDALYATAKGKPEWQAAAVKALKGLDLAGLK